MRLTDSDADRVAGGPPMQPGATGQLPSDYHQIELRLQAKVEYCRVPKVKGKRAGNGRKKIVTAGCGIKVKKRRASRKKRGKVLAQKPRKGEAVPPDTTVRIVVGR